MTYFRRWNKLDISCQKKRMCRNKCICSVMISFLLLMIYITALATDDNVTKDPKLYKFEIGPCRVMNNITCPSQHISFHTYEAHNILRRVEVTNEDYLIEKMDKSLSTKIIIHGYTSSMHESVLNDVRRAYQLQGSYNIISVNYDKIAAGDCYPAVVYNLQFIGRCVAHFVQYLHSQGVKDLHIIGFSLGAQVTNYIAINLRPYKVPRITGLDPAMPLFTTSNLDHKLDATDAEFVDIIHTNSFLQGKAERCGHVDFYMNGGMTQPGCKLSSHCDHHRAPQYFAESIITTKGFWGWKCFGFMAYIFGRCPKTGPKILMGEYVNKGSRGWYIVPTRDSFPYAIGR